MTRRNMDVYMLAGLRFGVEGASEYTRDLMAPYLDRSGSAAAPLIRTEVTPLLVQQERQRQGGGFSEDYLESIAVYRSFCEQALRFDVLFFHASAAAKDGEAFLFSGPSGAGKTTHAALWRQVFGSCVTMINDDKPLIRLEKDGAYVYGTPWAGKTGLQADIRLPVRGIAFLEKADFDRIRPLCFQESLRRAKGALFTPDSWELSHAAELLCRRLVNLVPCYELSCTKAPQAAVTAYEGMRRRNVFSA